MIDILLAEEFWPILSAFDQAQYYNFSSVFRSTINIFSCDEILSIVSNPNFPISLISADILAEKGACFAKLQLEVLEKVANPLESINFIASNWEFEQLSHFIKSAYQNNNLNVKWNNLCSNHEIFDLFIVQEEFSFLWEVIGTDCIKQLPVESVQKYIERVSNDLFWNSSVVNIMIIRTGTLSSLLSRIVPRNTESERIFSLDQVMRIVTIIATASNYYGNGEIMRKVNEILIVYLSRLKIDKNHRFPMRKKLKFIIKSFMEPVEEIRDFDKISKTLLRFVLFCKGIARGPWLLSVLNLWNHFRGENRNIRTFLDPFLNVFFAPETRLNVSDICLLLDLINLHVPNYSVTHVFNNHFPLDSVLTEGVYKERYLSLPNSIRASHPTFFLTFKLSFLFKRIRKIKSFGPFFVEIRHPKTLEETVWITISSKVYKIISSHPRDNLIVPLNLKTNYNGKIIDLSNLLILFFKSITRSSDWWIIKKPRWSSNDSRPVLIPSLNLPPQVMGIIGFLFACALSSNTKIPFLIDPKYFHLADYHVYQDSEKSRLLELLYPNAWEYYGSRQVYRVIKSLHHSTELILENASPYSFYLSQLRNEFPIVENSNEELFRIALSGSISMRTGLRSVMPADALKPKLLYKLLFK